MNKKQARRLRALCVLLGIGTFLSGCPGLDVVVFADKALESAIRAELRQPFGLLTQADLLQL
ncbi:MAG: hypothetical protein QG656_580, partial [Candidatus Hydrogenedentes bacterium]|nr:hypothetical protein [Candidatus Hydrogenedentota bacterium]